MTAPQSAYQERLAIINAPGFIAGRDAAIQQEMVRWRADLAVRGTRDETLINPLGEPMRISTEYGFRIHPITGLPEGHNALDGVPADGSGTAEVLAASSGRILYAGPYSGKAGNIIIMGDDAGRIVFYAHLADRSFEDARAGQRFNQGQRMASMGGTGEVTAPHLHFGVRLEPDTSNAITNVLNAPGEAISSLIDRVRGDRVASDGVGDGAIPYNQLLTLSAGSLTTFADYTYANPRINGRTYSEGQTVPFIPPQPRVSIGELREAVVTGASETTGPTGGPTPVEAVNTRAAAQTTVRRTQ